MNVTEGPIIVILMRLATILRGAIVARATLGLKAVVLLAQVITPPFLISSLELYVSKSSVQFSSIEGAVGTYFNLCHLVLVIMYKSVTFVPQFGLRFRFNTSSSMCTM